jgi:two-component system, OmpR family, KDP operon response regulator KdpE
MTSVLLAEDDLSISEPLARALRREGYEVGVSADGPGALEAARGGGIDLIVLDIGLPKLDGLEVCRLIRSEGQAVPVLILTARADEVDTVIGLDAGADDYVTKPFGMDELVARLRAAVRRAVPGDAAPVITTEHFTIDLVGKQVLAADGERIKLTPTEWQILELLARNRGRLVTGRQILHEIWGPTYGTETNYLRVYLAQLRRKLEPDPPRPRYLITEPGTGYRFV